MALVRKRELALLERRSSGGTSRRRLPRQSLRDQAYDRLMLEEMVEVIPRKGVIVKPVILLDVLQMIDVRMINETQCARLAAARADDTHIESMSKVLEQA